MYKVKILTPAKHDISQAAKWYNEQQPGLGLRFTSYVRSKVSAIAVNPFAYSIRYANTRAVVLEIFPYMIHFTLEEEEKTIVISAVLHTSRKPMSEQ